MSDSLILDATQRLLAAGVDNPRLDARVLWNQVKSDTTLFALLIARRVAREPLAYLTGHKEFWSLDFEVGRGVLIPRPETETIIEQAIALFPDRAIPLNILDLGTGTGCLLVALLKEFTNATGLGVDKSAEAQAYALRNIARHHLAHRCKIQSGDWGEGLGGTYDLIVSNPPYVRTADLIDLKPEIRFEPVLALDGGADGNLAYRALVAEMSRLLSLDGRLILEIGVGQSSEVGAILTQSGLQIIKTASDLAGIPRVLVAGHRN